MFSIIFMMQIQYTHLFILRFQCCLRNHLEAHNGIRKKGGEWDRSLYILLFGEEKKAVDACRGPGIDPVEINRSPVQPKQKPPICILLINM